jgi:hypothetical protein
MLRLLDAPDFWGLRCLGSLEASTKLEIDVLYCVEEVESPVGGCGEECLGQRDNRLGKQYFVGTPSGARRLRSAAALRVVHPWPCILWLRGLGIGTTHCMGRCVLLALYTADKRARSWDNTVHGLLCGGTTASTWLVSGAKLFE